MANSPDLARLKPGMNVVVTEVGFWWMGDVIYKEGGARDPKVPTLFQIACVDTGGDLLGQSRSGDPRGP